MDWKVCFVLLAASTVRDVGSQSIAELAKMAGIDLKDVAGDAFEKATSDTESATPSGLRSLFGRHTASQSSSKSTQTQAKSAAFAHRPSAHSEGPSPCGNCGNCPSCLMKQMKMLNGDFGGYAAGSEAAGFPGMTGQFGSMGLTGDVESLNPMSSPFASDLGGLSGPFGAFGAGAAANFVPSDSYSPFVGAPSMLTGAAGLASGYESYPESPFMQRYPLQEEELPRPYPIQGRPRSRRPPPEPPQYEQQQGDDGPGEEQGSPQYDQGQGPEQEAPQGYAGSQESGPESQAAGYTRGQADAEQEYQDGPPSQRVGGYQRTDYARTRDY